MSGESPSVDESDIRQHLVRSEYRVAFGLLVERFQDRVFRLAWSLMRDQTLAEDLVQDVLVKVWKALPGFHGDASLSTWIYTITRNTCFTELKKRSRRPTVSLNVPEMEAMVDAMGADQGADPEAGAAMDVETLLAGLPDHYRRVVTLFYLEQRRYEEVSEMLGLPMGTVKTHLFRARKELLRIAARHTVQSAAF